MNNCVRFLGLCSFLAMMFSYARQTPVMNGRLEGDLDANSNRVVRVSAPVDGGDAANKDYVDEKSATAGKVKSVNGEEPDEDGNIALKSYDIPYEDSEVFTVHEKVEEAISISASARYNANIALDKAATAQATADKKVDKMTTTDGKLYAYVHTNSGTTQADGSRKVSKTALSGDENAIVQRDGLQIHLPATPTVPSHATSKAYVDGVTANAVQHTQGKAGALLVDIPGSGDVLIIEATGTGNENYKITTDPNQYPIDSHTKFYLGDGKDWWIANNMDVAEVSNQVDAVSDKVKAVSNQVQVIYTFLAGDGTHFSVTNYQREAGVVPTMSLYEVKGGVTNLVWSQREGMEETYQKATNYTDTAIANADIPDKAWGLYTSGTGSPAPENITWISTKEVALSGGLEYAKVMGANGGYFFLTYNGAAAQIASTNGWMEIKDDDGESVYRMQKSNSYTIGANVDSFEVTRVAGYDHIKMHFNVVSGSQPIIMASPTLSPAEWVNAEEIATVTWTQTIPTGWQAELDMTEQVNGYFFKGTVEVAGKSMIEYAKPIAVGSGIYCSDGIHKCRPVWNSNNTITWEVAP